MPSSVASAVPPLGASSGRSGLSLTLDAALAALEHAGLQTRDIDGVATWPGQSFDLPGFAPVGAPQLKEALRLELNWFSGGGETAGQLGAFVNACAAVDAGLARHVICFRTITEATAQAAARASPGKDGGAVKPLPEAYQWQIPFRAYSAVNWIALYAQRHFHDYGTTREQLAQIALNGRRNAALHPGALMREALTLDDYMASRMISSPLCLFDCDMPADGAVAIIVSHRDAAKDLRRAPINVESIGCAMHGRDSWDQFSDLASIRSQDNSAQMLWRTHRSKAKRCRCCGAL